MEPLLQQADAPNRPDEPDAGDAGGIGTAPIDQRRLVTAYCVRGHRHRLNGELDQAQLDFDQALRLDPACADAYNNRGNIFFARGEYERAIADYREAIRHQPGLATAYVNRALACARLGRFDESVADASAALGFDATLAGAHFIRGAAHAARGRLDPAIADFSAALRLDPTNPLTYNDRALAFTSKGEYARAIADCDQALRLDPQLVLAHDNRARACLLNGEHGQAVLGFTRVLQLAPNHLSAYYDRGVAHLAGAEYEAAAADFAEVLRRDPSNAAAKANHSRALLMASRPPQPPVDASPRPVVAAPAPVPAATAPIPFQEARAPAAERAVAALSSPNGRRPAAAPRKEKVLKQIPADSRCPDPVGVAALVAAAAALWCAQATSLSRVVLPLSVAGFLVGLVGLLRAWSGSNVRLLFPAAGTAAGAVVLLSALLAPDFLGPTYRAARARTPADPTAIHAVPLAESSTEARLGGPDWVDASRAALQQGRLRVHVIGATVGPVDADTARHNKHLPEKCLFIRLRVHQVEAAEEFAGHSQQTPALPQRPRPKLTDNSGNVYQLYEVNDLANTRTVRSAVFPVSFQVEVFAFDAPPPGLEHLRLEVPADAWGGQGAFRFTIPAAMIRQP